MLANEYANRNIEVAIMLFAGNQVVYELDKRVEIVSISAAPAGNVWLKIDRVRKIRSYLKKNEGCIIFAFSSMGAAYCVLASYLMNIFILVSERSDPYQDPNYKWRDWAYKQADCLAFQTKEAMEFFPASVRKKSVVIPNPVDGKIPNRFEGKRKKNIVSSGRLETVKNIPLLLKSFKIFIQEHPEYNLHIYGTGSLERELKELASSLNIVDNVVWHGFTQNVVNEIVDSGMYILSSDHEGLSNSMLEALAMGIPTIATDVPMGGCRTYIKNEENGLLVPIKDEKAMARAMSRLADNQDFASYLSLNATKIRELYSIAEIADRFLNLVRK
ncbi:MAG: glycosyltransferase [Lachnospiraceae bacterium]|nr:glycosyltransferase [Lachnospiraceae bacterium]